MSDPIEKNRFGRWMEAMNTICNTNYARIACHIGVTKSALSQSIRKGGGVKPKTSLAIMEMYRTLATQQNIPWLPALENFFLLSCFDDEVISQAEETLRHIEFMASVTRERNTLLEENERLKGEIERRGNGNS